MAVEYFKASVAVVELVSQVREQYHPDLMGARIGVIFRETAAKSRGRRVMGEARKVSALQQIYIPFDFLLIFPEDVWGELDAYQRRALVDHELCHCTITPKEQTRMVPHDVEMFKANFERFGFWWPFAEETEQIFQARLGLGEAVGEVEAVQMGILQQVETMMEDGEEEAEEEEDE